MNTPNAHRTKQLRLGLPSDWRRFKTDILINPKAHVSVIPQDHNFKVELYLCSILTISKNDSNAHLKSRICLYRRCYKFKKWISNVILHQASTGKDSQETIPVPMASIDGRCKMNITHPTSFLHIPLVPGWQTEMLRVIFLIMHKRRLFYDGIPSCHSHWNQYIKWPNAW